MVDVDDSDQAEVLYKIVNDLNINCVVIQTGRGKHFYFRNNEVKSNKNRTNTAISIVADMKMGQTSYGVIKMDGKFRNILKASEELDMLPKWLFPINHKINFFDLEVGDRNQSLFNYILTLQSEAFTVEEARETIRLINRYILKEPWKKGNWKLF